MSLLRSRVLECRQSVNGGWRQQQNHGSALLENKVLEAAALLCRGLRELLIHTRLNCLLTDYAEAVGK